MSEPFRNLQGFNLMVPLCDGTVSHFTGDYIFTQPTLSFWLGT